MAAKNNKEFSVTSDKSKLEILESGGLKKYLSLNLRYFKDKPCSWNDIAKTHHKSFIKFVKMFESNYEELWNTGKFVNYNKKTEFEKGFNISAEAKELIGEEKLTRVALHGSNTKFRIFGYIVGNHFCLLFFDPGHDAKKG